MSCHFFTKYVDFIMYVICQFGNAWLFRKINKTSYIFFLYIYIYYIKYINTHTYTQNFFFNCIWLLFYHFYYNIWQIKLWVPVSRLLGSFLHTSFYELLDTSFHFPYQTLLLTVFGSHSLQTISMTLEKPDCDSAEKKQHGD